ncbi:DNA gyrase subunit A [Caldalkalibacillus uzonensis]|uniref:DNA gyrase subunit A n=1 Tax=Caldalkalibacillus uzonensis TaxID=353224 RepID=A0ABU0CTM1_9BACI|nr:DNA gyrase subunit A [Caldalkalibacillus uzonensis]MDQ0339256.1 DNA gyrase subunit A [Caldalkalibacillus uzonensis]
MAEQRIKEVNIGQEMRNSFMDYAMSVIVSRALPDVRDGLKPVHRRILFAMNELGMTPDKPYKKSARIVGEVIGKYHPHGDMAVYDTLVRMAQDFSYRYPLIDGHGNFGSIDGDAAAAMRYTEAKMAKIATELLRDIHKETIDYQDNYDGQEKEPVVLPSRFPNFLVNGAAGIAVGMATNVPPHQLGEVIDALHHLIDHPDATVADLMEFIPGPDFPTGAQILGTSGIRRAYNTGRGTITLRAKTNIEVDDKGKQRIIVDELPYQVNKAKLIEKIAELVREKKIDGITDLRDESDRNGMRVVIELRRDVNANVVLNNLYKQTALQTTFGINMLALVDGEPKVLNLKQVLKFYLDHQKEVIRRRTEYDLRKAEARAHILEGLRVALDHLDAVIDLIRSSRTTEEAKSGLMSNFNLTAEQAQAILDMRLQRLTGLEREKIENEYQELLAKIADLKAILADERKILNVIKEELNEIKEKYNDERRTEITVAVDLIEDEDLIPQEEVVISLTHKGYIKRLPVTTYRSQKRGGRGITGLGTKDDDFVEHLFVANTHDFILLFTNKGRVYRLKAYEIPELGRTARGLPIINLIQIEKDEYITALIQVENYQPSRYLFFATRCGIVKRTALDAFEHVRRAGLFAINLRDDDELISVRLTDGQQEIIMGTKKGMAIRFSEQDVRVMGRAATGVKGITLRDDDEVIGMDVVKEDHDVMIVSRKGYGKRTPIDEYRAQTRGGIGIKTFNVTDEQYEVVGLKTVAPHDDFMLVTSSGLIIRIHVNDVSQLSRYARGVRLIRLQDEEEVATVAKVQVTEEAQQKLDEENES